MTNLIKNDLLALKDKLESIEEEFSVKLKEVESKSKSYKDLDERYAETAKNNDFFIKINVGGKIFSVKFSTIVSIKDTLFYNLIAKHLSYNNELPKNLFFDRNFIHFHLILDYLRSTKLSLRDYNKFEKEEIKEELEFYGIDLFKKGIKSEFDVAWDQQLSKPNTFTIDQEDQRILKINSNTCYTHFLTNRTFEEENFVVEFETTVVQNDFYYYIGIMNESYQKDSNCGCCSPANAYYIQCDGTLHINGGVINDNIGKLVWNSSKCILGIRVMLSEKQIYFYKDGPENEVGPYNIASGTNFRIYAGHCNTGNGNLTILSCYAV